MARREISVIVTTNYDARIFKRSLSLPMVRAVIGAAVFLALAALVALILAGAGAYRLGRLAFLESRNRQLEQEFQKFVLLKQRVVELEEQAQRMATMLGVEMTPPAVDWGLMPVESVGAAGMTGTWPVPALPPLEDYVMSRGFGQSHKAVDLAAQAGTPVRAAGDGVVVELGTDSVFGRYVLLRHGQGYETYYAHMAEWRARVGDTLRAGEPLGAVGSTGRSSAPHLHFEVRRGKERIDPASLVRF